MQDLVAAKLKKKVEDADLTSPVDNDSADAGTSAETEVTGADPTAEFYDDITYITNEPTHRGRRSLIDVNSVTIVNDWLDTTRSDKLEDEDFQLRQILIDLFIQFNTPVPSSAGVERLFSQAGDILRPKRISLGDDRFHQLMFMRNVIYTVVCLYFSVVYPGCLSRIRDPRSGSGIPTFFHPGF